MRNKTSATVPAVGLPVRQSTAGMQVGKSFSPEIWRLVAYIHRDANWLLDALGESENNLQRDEAEFLLINLRSLFALARRIHRRRERALRLLAKAKHTGRLASKAASLRSLNSASGTPGKDGNDHA